MATKTYAPGMAKRLHDVYRYYGKHKAKIEATVSAQEVTDLRNIIGVIQTNWLGEYRTEQP